MTDDQRRSERERREAALATASSCVEPGAREVPPARLKQMLSLRMEPELIRAIRTVAESREMSVSDLLREAAMDLVERHRRQPVQIEVEMEANSGTMIEPIFYASGTGITGPLNPSSGLEIPKRTLSA